MIRPSFPPRLRRVRTAFLGAALTLSAALSGFAQTFVAEWNASVQGGIGPVGLVLATESGANFLYAADHPRGRVIKFNTATGAIAAVFGQPGSANGDFNAPYGLARDAATGDIYVAERGNHRISRITSSGTFVMAWGAQGTGAGQFNEPIGVAVDPAGDVYVTDHANHRVQKFRVAQAGGAWAATHLASWGAQGSANGQFNLPYGITADASGNLWVADGFNGRVQRFNLSGVHQSTLGSAGSAAGQFIVATWVGLHPAGDVLVTSTNSNPQDGTLADAANQWVSRFTAAGVFVSRFGGAFGGGPSQFRLPFSAVVDSANRAYVSDYYNSRIQIFDLAATPPAGGGGTGGTPGPDTTAPTVASLTTGATTASSVTYQLTFSEAVAGVDAADFAIVTTGGATAAIGALSGGAASYTIPVTFSGTGTVRLDLKVTGTGIADTAGNAIATGATGAVYTIPTPGAGTGGGGTVTGTRVVSVTTPPNRRYDKGDELTFTVSFSGRVFVRGGDSRDEDDDDDEDDDESVYFTWSAVAASGSSPSSGEVRYKSGSGSDRLTFRYKVKNGDVALTGIRLGTTLVLERGVSLRDSAGGALAAAQLTLPWTQNPLTGVIIDAPKSGNSNAGGNGNGKGRSERLINLSSRLRVTGGDASRSVVAGFVVTGNAPKPILIRAVGPGLAGFGIRDALAQPRLVLRDSMGKTIAENDGWNNRLEINLTGDKVGAFRLMPGSRDAAIIAALMPGAYTAQVTANGNGLVLLEVYDAATGTELDTEQIVNISTRGFVGTDDDVLVAGFVVVGKAPKRVLIRGIGPGLAAFGVTGTLADPVLKLYSAGTTTPIAQNDNWQTPQPASAAHVPATAAEISAATTAAGAFPLAAGGKDAALVVTLSPGNYSAILSGANQGTGAGLVEVYELP